MVNKILTTYENIAQVTNLIRPELSCDLKDLQVFNTWWKREIKGLRGEHVLKRIALKALELRECPSTGIFIK